MSRPDLGMLVTLDVLLSEGSVARAARRLRLSPSAMSRALARLRRTMGDPLLVRAGRGLVATPRAVAIRESVGRVVREGEAILRPAEAPDLARLARTFTLRTSDGFVENFGPLLIARAAAEAPSVRLRFLLRADADDGASLRDGTVDLEIGIVRAATSPEVKVQALFRDRFVGVVRRGHALARGKVTLARYTAAKHVGILRRGSDRGPVDAALEALGLGRAMAASVGAFAAALALARASDFVATVPDRVTGNLRGGLHSFPLPLAVPEITVSLLWHPRMEADPAHQWLRRCVRAACLAERRR